MRRLSFFSLVLVLMSACGSSSETGNNGDSDTDGNAVKLTIEQPDHGSITASPAGPYELGATVTLTATPDENYGFGSWVGLDGSVNPATTTLDEDTTVSATFIKDALTLLVSASPAIGGTVTVSPSAPYTKGQLVEVTATPADGYTFDAWSGSSSTEASLTLTLTENVTLVANFVRIPANVSVTVKPASSAAAVTVTPEGQHFVGDTVTVELTPQLGFVFDKWSDGDASTSRQFVLTGDLALSATLIVVPIVTGEDVHVGNETPYTVSWTYAGQAFSYLVETSTNGGPFQAFFLALPFTSLTATPEPGTYCYRVRAKTGILGSGPTSPYSNTHCVERLPGEKRIKIINDVASWKPAGQELNDIVRLHVGIGDDSWSNPNKLTPVQVIRAATGTYTLVTTGLPSNYQVDFAAGYWDCQGTNGCFWHATQTKVIGCDQHTEVYKLQAVAITNHTYDTLFIHTKDWFPVGNYGQCINGQCAVDPVCH